MGAQMRLFAWLAIPAGLGLSVLSSCASLPGVKIVQAPYDAYVCLDTSFAKCMASIQQSRFDAYKKGVYADQFIGNSITVQDPDAGKPVTSKDGLFHCNFGTIPYTQVLDQNTSSALVFVPTNLIDQIGEQLIKLKRIREACQRTIDAYDIQVVVAGLQKQQTTAQKAVQYLSAKVENSNLVLTNNTELSAQDIQGFGLTPPAAGASLLLPDAMLSERNAVTQNADQIQIQLRTRQDTEYPKQLADAQLAIDTQLREIARELVALDGAVLSLRGGSIVHTYADKGGWVHQGTKVALVRD